MKADHDKCYVLQGTQEANFSIKSSTTKKLLVINFDNNPKFDINVESILSESKQKTQCPHMELPKKRILIQ